MSAAEEFIQRLIVMFGNPDTHDIKAYVAEYGKQLKSFDANELERAGDVLLRRHKFRTWPTVSECVKAAEEAREAIRPAPVIAGPKYPEWTKQRIAQADQMIVSDMGREAADEGWALSLHDFCRKHQRLPHGREVHDCRVNAKGFDDAFNLVSSGGAGPLGKSLTELGEAMLAKRDRLARMAHGEVFE